MKLRAEGRGPIGVRPGPDKVICVGRNYRDHVAATGRTMTVHSALFPRYAEGQVGHLQPLVTPKVSAVAVRFRPRMPKPYLRTGKIREQHSVPVILPPIR